MSPPVTRSRRDCTGFSLVEVLAVVLVLGVLAAIAVPSLARGKRELAWLATVKSDVRNFALLQKMYAVENEVYGDTAQVAGFGDGARYSPDNKVEVISGAGHRDGFCLMAMHQPSRLVWFYDSEDGGLMAPGESCVPCQGTGGAGGGSGTDYCPGSNGDGHYRDCGSGTVCTNPPRSGQSGGALDPTQDPSDGSNGGGSNGGGSGGGGGRT